MKYKVRVIDTQVREVPLYKYVYDENMGHIKTDQVLKTVTVERKQVLFSGSPEAFRIWKAGHVLPATAEVREGLIKDASL